MTIKSLNWLRGIRNGWAVEQRLRWIDGALRWDGTFNRGDLALRFGVSEAQASGDVSLYNDLSGNGAVYDARCKVFRPATEFVQLSRVDLPEWLRLRRANGGAEEIPGEPAMLGIPAVAARSDDTLLPEVYRALRWRRPCTVTYFSAARNGPIATAFCPHALFGDGTRLWARGWDAGRAGFVDLCLQHVLEVRAAEGAAWVPGDADAAWNTTVEITFVPAQGLGRAQRFLAEREHGMRDGSTAVTVRVAMAGHLLRCLGLLEAAREGRPSADRVQLALGEPQAASLLIQDFDA